MRAGSLISMSGAAAGPFRSASKGEDDGTDGTDGTALAQREIATARPFHDHAQRRAALVVCQSVGEDPFTLENAKGRIVP